MNKIIIIGTGETAEIAYDYFINDSTYTIEAFAVEKKYMESEHFLGLPVVDISTIEQVYPPEKYDAFVAISFTKLNRVRRKLFNIAKEKGYTLVSYISSHAFVGRNVKIGENCFIPEFNDLQYGVNIKDNVTLWSGNHIGHRTTIRENCFVAAKVVVASFCDVGQNCFLGASSSIANNLKIEEDSFIGVGAVVAKETEKGKAYFGNPARPHIASAYKMLDVEKDET